MLRKYSRDDSFSTGLRDRDLNQRKHEPIEIAITSSKVFLNPAIMRCCPSQFDKDAAPAQTRSPATSHTETPIVDDDTCLLTSDGAEKMPEPICKPTTRARPFRNVNELRTSSSDAWSKGVLASTDRASEASLDYDRRAELPRRKVC
jgi:hypothetical protein